MKLDKLYHKSHIILEDGPEVEKHRFVQSGLEHPLIASPSSFVSSVNYDEVVRKSDEAIKVNQELLLSALKAGDAERVLQASNRIIEAYRTLKIELQKNYISGLRQHPIEKEQTIVDGKSVRSDYIHVFGDLDNMKKVNENYTHHGANIILQYFGSILHKNLEAEYVDVEDLKLTNDEAGVPKYGRKLKSGVERTKTQHPHGDEFSALVNVTGLSDLEKGIILVNLIEALMKTSNTLSKTPIYRDKDAFGKPIGEPDRVTVTFAIGTKKSSVIILQKVKKRIKYVVAVDSNLINQYIINPQIKGTDKELETVKKLRQSLETISKGFGASAKGKGAYFDVVQTENKNPALEAVSNREGCLLLELNPNSIPRHEKLELENEFKEKWRYLDDPVGACPIRCGSRLVLLPLKETYLGHPV